MDVDGDGLDKEEDVDVDVEGGKGAIHARAEGLAGKEGKYVAWRSLRKEGEEASRGGGGGNVEELSLGRDGGMEAGWRSGGGFAGGRSEAASRDRSAVEEEFERVLLVELGVASGMSKDGFWVS